jgi:hypothetical protein
MGDQQLGHKAQGAYRIRLTNKQTVCHKVATSLIREMAKKKERKDACVFFI